MIQTECDALVEQLLLQLEPRFVPEPGTSACALRTPFLYPDNTPIVVFVRTEAQKVIVSDHGEASDYAFLNGVDTDVVQSQITMAGRRHGLTNMEDELVAEADPKALATAVLAVVGAAQDIGYLVCRQSPGT